MNLCAQACERDPPSFRTGGGVLSLAPTGEVSLREASAISLRRETKLEPHQDIMSRIWTLILSFAVSGLTQNASNRTLFLISGPEVLHVDTPIPLAVTVFADFLVKLTADVSHGNTTVTHTENIQGGVTKVFMLPPFPGPLSQNSLLNLTLRGYSNSSLIFTGTSTLTPILQIVSSFIQTDRSRYKPGDTIKARVVSVQQDNKPYKGTVQISLMDPSGRVVDVWNTTGNLGIVSKEFSLSQMSPLGQWVIAATVNGHTDDEEFIVENEDDPPFEVLIETSSYVLVGDDITGSVRASFPSGQPVEGTLVVSITPAFQTHIKMTHGSTPFFFSKDQLQDLEFSPENNSKVFYITAQVNDSISGLTAKKAAEVHLIWNKFQLMFRNFPSPIKPSLNFSINLQISRYDGTRLTSLDLNNSVVVEVTQNTSIRSTERMNLTLPVPADGNVLIQFKLQTQVEILFIQARFQSAEETLKIYSNHSSPSGSYIQISAANTSPAQTGPPLRLNVESTFKPTTLHFVVSSQGQVLAAGTKNFSSSLDLMPALSWYPEACVTVYCVSSDGEIVSDSVWIPIDQQSHVILNWSSERAQPGEKTCNLMMMTNTGLQEGTQPHGLQNGAVDDFLNIEKYWNHRTNTAESLLWLDANVSYNWTSGGITVPDGVASLEVLALVMSEDQGFSFIPVQQRLTIAKDFSLFFTVPPSMIRGEEIVLEVNVTNHLDKDLEVIVFIAQTEAFEFVLMTQKEASVINAQRLYLGAYVTSSARFPIRFLVLGEVELSVNAMSAEASGKFVQRLLVKPEGVEQSFSETLFLEITPEVQAHLSSISFSFPPGVVPGSQKAHFVLVGDILALSFENLESLVQIPTGCGEQNMIHFAPSVYVVQYLDKSFDDDAELRSKALSYMKKGYENQLLYQREDGSFSAFGKQDASGSMWLTAFVVRCLLQAQPYIEVDPTVLSRAMTWLLKHQGSEGEFIEVGKLIHTEMQGGLDNDSSAALTAYVLLAFLEDINYSSRYEGKVSLALEYLENEVTVGVSSNYSLCLVAYALALGNSPVAITALAELTRRADYEDGVMMWTLSANQMSYPPPHSARVEMTSYVLLAFFMRGSIIEGISLMKWLSTQRNFLGSFDTTQDTVVALQALASYAAFSGASAIDLRVTVSNPASSFVSLIQINSTNYRMYQSQEIDAEKDLPLNIALEGRGFAVLQLNVFYNVESKNFSRNVQHASDKDSFSLDFNLSHSNRSHMDLTVCTRLKDNQPVPQTGMAILDVGVLSGFSLLPGGAAEEGLIRKVDSTSERVSLYLDSVNKSEVCVKLPFVRVHNVARVEDAVLRVYDYYEPTRKATRTYNSGFLRSVDSCYFCGENCDSCRPGITIKLSSHSSGAFSSLSSLILGVTAVLLICF
nr:CD109 antigen isoform X2 [Nothobranchius furzeri]